MMAAMIKTMYAVMLWCACGGKPTPSGAAEPSPAVPTSGTASTAGAPLTPDRVQGYWSGDWGRLVFKVDGDRILGAYSHDDGTIVGTIVGDKLVGWWCEVPSRKPTADAGDVEMKFITKEDGTRAIDGRWRYGAEGEFREDWDIGFSPEAAPEALVKRFSDASAFCPKP